MRRTIFGMARIFSEVTESDITRTITSMFNDALQEYSRSDVIVIGAGPAGLTAAREIAGRGIRTLVIEQNNYLGGGYWVGGYMMNPVTVRAPAQMVWDELRVSYKKVSDGLYAAWGPEACSKLISAACDAGVHFLQLTKFDDLVLKNKRVGGVVVNWMPVSALPRNITCVDPIALESRIVVDASGHDSVAVKRLMQRGLIDWKGMDPMWVDEGEDAVVENTAEIFPGLVATGMCVTETFGLPRMGPTFGSMLLSGKKVGEIVVDKLKRLSEFPRLR
ncbi:MAG TPA: sulfide-dependent adenosine diphosphate thiazole synthase [Nitrososphaeraceae archaeon]|jgi:thiamine thiazole synthase|nr:sulfide-dependent adenosine diphosphate thiazole synthase [Nitrososphaeraceae archaeon]